MTENLPQLDVRKQPRMGLVQLSNMTLHGIRYRLFRSFVTVMVIVVAIAFLMNIICESLITRAVSRSVQDRLADERLAVQWTSRLTKAPALAALIEGLAVPSPQGPVIAEVQAFGDLDATGAEALRQDCLLANRYLQFITRLDYSKSRQLFHRARSTTVFDRLQDQDAFEGFAENLAKFPSLSFPAELSEFRAFLRRWPALKERLTAVQSGWQAATRKIAAAVPNGLDMMQALTDADASFGEQVRETGFVLPEAAARQVAALADQAVLARTLIESLRSPTMQRAVAGYADVMPDAVTISLLWNILSTPSGATWYLQQAVDASVDLPAVPADAVVDAARQRQRATRLASVENLADSATGGPLGLGERMSWLILVSMLVCTVGIANAMLMAVTERFREIATLKCLGALDGTILLMFVFEASLFGVVGGIFGAILGLLIGIGRMWVRFGRLLGPAIPTGDLLWALLAALGFGVVLAALASVYPSFKAARLAPMEAMRIE